MGMSAKGGSGYFTLSLDQQQFKLAGKVFVKRLKELVDPEDRDYNDTDFQWTIKNRWWEPVRALWLEFFNDPNQEDMFD